MNVRTSIPAPTSDALAWWTACELNGLALGAAPSMLSWGLPPLYRSGVRFAYEPAHGSGEEDFAAPPVTYERQWGDCDDLVYWRLAELYAAELPESFAAAEADEQIAALRRVRARAGSGKLPLCFCEFIPGLDAFHVWIGFPDGTREDPAKLLGAPAP